VTLETLEKLRSSHAFDHAPRRQDLAAYYVTSVDLGAKRDLESRLEDGARNGQRLMIVGPSGCGKTSLIEYVFNPRLEGVLPIPVRLSPEPDAVVVDPQRVAQHVIHSLGDQARRAARSTHRSTDRSTTLALGASWMGVGLSGEITRQLATVTGPQTAAATFEALESLLQVVHHDGYMPVLLFDDTDRWFNRENLGPAREFFEKVMPEIRELPCGVVVTAHDIYVEDAQILAHLKTCLEDRIDISRLGQPENLAAVLQSRISYHAPGNKIVDVLETDAFDAVWQRYSGQDTHDLRGVIRALHVALTEACDDRLERIPAGLINSSDW